MREADFQTIFGHWVQSQEGRDFIGAGCAFELKFCRKGQALPFSAIPEHQILALRRVRGGEEGSEVMYYKISDVGGAVSGLKPFDCFALQRCGGWFAVCWWQKGEGVRRWYMISVEVMAEEIAVSLAREGLGVGRAEGGRKSLTEARAMKIGWLVEVE